MPEGCCGSASGCGSTTLSDDETDVFGANLYDGADRERAPEAAVAASMGCGVPTAVAELHEGETFLDLGSGAGADVLISAHRVGPSGKAIGLDMTDEMLALAPVPVGDLQRALVTRSSTRPANGIFGVRHTCRCSKGQA